MELNRGARLKVQFEAASTGIREVILESGEAHFQVAPNAERPFVVLAGGVTVRAVGTAFAVELATGAVNVLVTEGQVAVASASGPAATPPLALVDAGHRVRIVQSAGSVPPPPVIGVSATEQAERLAWRVPRLDLSGTPLAEVLPHFNRHGSSRLELADTALGRLQLSGLLRADDTAALLRVLENEFGLIAKTRGASTVIRRR